jgi:hypothetical protein
MIMLVSIEVKAAFALLESRKSPGKAFKLLSGWR